jgi:peroxiredoxin
VGWQTLARNLLLGGVAVFVVVGGWRDPGVSATHWLARLDTAGAVGLAAGLVVAGLAGFLVWFCFQVLRQNGRILARLEAIEARLGGVPAGAIPSSNGHVEEWRPGLPVGTPAPEFELPDLDGELVSLEDLMGRGLRVLLVFSDPGCGPCGELMPDVGRWQREHAERFRLVVLSRGEAEENREKASEFGLELLLLQEDREVGDLFECYGTPGAVLIDANGLVASPVAQGSDEIAELVARASDPLGVMQVAGTNGNHPGQDAFSRVGEPAPSLELPDLDGSTVKLTDLLGERVLLLFWNPQCGFCQQMLSDLKAWEADPPEGAPGLIVVSTGGVEDNRAQGLRSTVLLDHDFSAGSAFGAGGTPMAVLIDADGNTASEVVGGAQAVFDLANTPAQDMVAR